MLHLGGNPLIRTIRIRPPSPKCVACGPEASITVDTFDYEEFCSGPADLGEEEGLTLGGPDQRISVEVGIQARAELTSRTLLGSSRMVRR
jgi:adenylyltransferase/sulfurtransferase